VGLATVKGLAYAAGKPLVGIASLDVLAMNALKSPAARICAVTDARRHMVYAALYRKKGEELKRTGGYRLLKPAELLEDIKEDTLFIGDGVPLIKEQLAETKPAWTAGFAPERDWHPSARALAKLACRRFENKDFDDLDRLVPLYLYAEDCQVSR
jgi:tRNA threonylcarbamoyladenosine biosynthesis protein TsaB